MAKYSRLAVEENEEEVSPRNSGAFRLCCDASDESSEEDCRHLEEVLARGVPECFISRAMKLLMTRSYPVSLRTVSGQAIPLCFIITVLLWSLLPCFSLIAYRTTVPLDNGGVRYSWWTWLGFVPVLLACATLELICFRLIVVPKIQILSGFHILGHKAPFIVWFLWTWFQSFVSYSAFASQGLFYGTLFSQTKRRVELANIWHTLIQQSVFGKLPHSWLPGLNSAGIIVVCAQYLRLLAALALCVPHLCKRRSYKVDYEMICIESKKKSKVDYATLVEDNQNHGAALMVLASLNGTNLVLFGDLQYALEKARLENEKSNEKFNPEAHDLARKHVMTQLQRGLFNACFTDGLANGLLVNLQVSVLVMSAALDGTTPDANHQALLAITITHINSLYRLWDSFRIAYKTLPFYLQFEEIDLSSPFKTNWAQKMRSDLTKWTIAMHVALLLNTFVWLYAAAKLIMGFFCPHSIWNINGCADLPSVFG